MKRDRVVKVPKADENEAAAIRIVLGMAQHFVLENSDLGLNSTSKQRTERGSETAV